MQKALKILSWIQITAGGLGAFGLMSMTPDDSTLAALFILALMVSTGIVALSYISSVKKA